MNLNQKLKTVLALLTVYATITNAVGFMGSSIGSLAGNSRSKIEKELLTLKRSENLSSNLTYYFLIPSKPGRELAYLMFGDNEK